MTDSSPPETSLGVALELERLRGAIEVGFATTRGDLALLLQRTEQAEKTLDEHEHRLEALERNRWPLASIAALTGLLALAIALYDSLAG